MEVFFDTNNLSASVNVRDQESKHFSDNFEHLSQPKLTPKHCRLKDAGFSSPTWIHGFLSVIEGIQPNSVESRVSLAFTGPYSGSLNDEALIEASEIDPSSIPSWDWQSTVTERSPTFNLI